MPKEGDSELFKGVPQEILEHLGLSTAAPTFRAPPDPPDGRAADQLHEWSYEALFDLPVSRSLSACNAQAGGAGQTGDRPIPDPELV